MEGRALEQIEHVRVGVLGAGVMGAGIAQVMAIAGHDVVGYDVDRRRLSSPRATTSTPAGSGSGERWRGKLLTQDGGRRRPRPHRLHRRRRAVAEGDIVIEAIPERLDLKIEVFRDLDRRCRPDTVLASNSSGFPIQALAAATDRPDRVVGWHWASPAPVMQLAEIVRAPETSDETVEPVERLAAAGRQAPGRGAGQRRRRGATSPTGCTGR